VSWWNTSDGGSATDTGKQYTSAGGDFEIIPKNTKVLASVDEAAWKAVYQGTAEFVNVKWRIMKPSQYEGRVIFQKLFVDEPDPRTPSDKISSKRDAAKRQLSVIDNNHKGKLSKLTARPTNEQLALGLIGAQAVLALDLWDIDGKQGNWVRAITPKGSEITADAAKASSRGSEAPPVRGPFDDDIDLDDDVPFISNGFDRKIRMI